MTTLETLGLAPTKLERVIDLVRAAGVVVDDWANFAGGPERAASNPKYCYDWAFVEPGKVVVLNLWYRQLDERDGAIVREANFRKNAQRHATRGGKAVWAKRGERMDAAIAEAWHQSLPVRVIVCDGKMREGNDPSSKASQVRGRRLDPASWAVTSYDEGTGDCILVRESAASLESRFHNAMLDVYRLAGLEVGYWAKRFRQAVVRRGGRTTAKRMLRAGSSSSQTGLRSLVRAGRPDLSVEALVCRPMFESLFSSDEISEARRRLASMTGEIELRHNERAQLYPDEADQGIQYVEGARTRVEVNAYERNRNARLACLSHWGYSCSVCDLLFSERFGILGAGFIHVHHKKPLTNSGGSYRVDPIRDLVPVCPNCHAMLHREDPPLTVEDLRARIGLLIRGKAGRTAEPRR